MGMVELTLIVILFQVLLSASTPIRTDVYGETEENVENDGLPVFRQNHPSDRGSTNSLATVISDPNLENDHSVTNKKNSMSYDWIPWVTVGIGGIIRCCVRVKRRKKNEGMAKKEEMKETGPGYYRLQPSGDSGYGVDDSTNSREQRCPSVTGGLWASSTLTESPTPETTKDASAAASLTVIPDPPSCTISSIKPIKTSTPEFPTTVKAGKIGTQRSITVDVDHEKP